MSAAIPAAVLPPDNFSRWLSRFLPNLHTGDPVRIFTPVRVSLAPVLAIVVAVPA